MPFFDLICLIYPGMLGLARKNFVNGRWLELSLAAFIANVSDKGTLFRENNNNFAPVTSGVGNFTETRDHGRDRKGLQRNRNTRNCSWRTNVVFDVLAQTSSTSSVFLYIHAMHAYPQNHEIDNYWTPWLFPSLPPLYNLHIGCLSLRPQRGRREGAVVEWNREKKRTDIGDSQQHF